LLGDRASTLVQTAVGDVYPKRSESGLQIDRAMVVEVAILRREHGGWAVASHLRQVEVDVVMTGGTPVLDHLPMAIEEHDVTRGEHVDVGVGQVLQRPGDIERGEAEKGRDRDSDRHPMRPEPAGQTVTLPVAAGSGTGR